MENKKIWILEIWEDDTSRAQPFTKPELGILWFLNWCKDNDYNCSVDIDKDGNYNLDFDSNSYNIYGALLHEIAIDEEY